MLSRSHALQRARSRVNAAAKDSARSREAQTKAACCARRRRLYHVERLTPAASHGCCAGRRGPIPCALRHRSERKRFFSRRSASVIFFRVKKSPRIRLTTASIELTEDEAALVRETAAFYKMKLPDFLAGALRSGIAHAEDRVDMYDETKTATPFDADDLPF
jgi:hypothetical protein